MAVFTSRAEALVRLGHRYNVSSLLIIASLLSIVSMAGGTLWFNVQYLSIHMQCVEYMNSAFKYQVPGRRGGVEVSVAGKRAHSSREEHPAR